MLVVVSCLLAAALIAGCGSGSARSTSDAAASAAAQDAALDATVAHREKVEAQREKDEAIEASPRLLERSFAPNPYPEPAATRPHPHGDVKRVVIRELKRGSGTVAGARDVVYIDFVKTFYRSGRKFLVAWGPHRTAYAALAGEAPGIRRGIVGMRPGGRRTIVLPKIVGDVHGPSGEGWEIAVMQVVLRRVRHIPIS